MCRRTRRWEILATNYDVGEWPAAKDELDRTPFGFSPSVQEVSHTSADLDTRPVDSYLLKHFCSLVLGYYDERRGEYETGQCLP